MDVQNLNVFSIVYYVEAQHSQLVISSAGTQLHNSARWKIEMNNISKQSKCRKKRKKRRKEEEGWSKVLAQAITERSDPFRV